MKLIVATQNPGKVVEIREALAGTGVEVVMPAEVGLADFDVEETGATFAANARLKAEAFSRQAKLPALADDSGLMVRALGGAPGVYSKRLIDGTDHDRNQHLLELMNEADDRFAEFITVLCFSDVSRNQVEYFEGRVTGRIGFEERGHDGFGYDPVFIPEGYDKTFAELGLTVKQTLSHRGRALEAFKNYLGKENR